MTDAAGNAATLTHVAVTDNASYLVDTTIATPTLSFTDTGIGSSDYITNNGTMSVGSLEAGGSWQYQVDGGSWTTGSGSSFSLTAGSHTYAVKQTDLAGNTATSTTTASITYDVTAPTVSSIAITSASGIQNNRLNAGDVVSVTVTMSEATTVTGTPQLGLNIGLS